MLEGKNRLGGIAEPGDPHDCHLQHKTPARLDMVWCGTRHHRDISCNRDAKRQYVVGAVHTQTIEGFWSIFERGIVGSFHKVSAKYLPLYIAEFQFRYNNRFNDDIFGTAIRGC